MEHAAPAYPRTRTYTAAIGGVAALLAVISGLGLGLRMLYLGRESFWSDEILSVQRASTGWFEGGTHMVAYHTALRVWLTLGDSEATIRTLSVLFAVATIPVVYLVGKQLFSTATGVLAAFLLAINTYHIQYAQEARAYSLLLLMLSLSSLFFIRLLEKPTRLIWAAYVITSALVVYSHVFGGIALLAQVGSLLFLHWRRIPWKWLMSAWIGMAFMLDFIVRRTIGAVWVQMFGQVEGGGGIQWIPAPTFDTVKATVFALIGNGSGSDGELLLAAYATPIALALMAALAAWLYSLWGLTRRRRAVENESSLSSPTALPASWKFAFLFMWLVFPISLLMAASLINPVFVPRYTISTIPALVLVAAAGFTCTFQFFRNRLPIVLTAVPTLALGVVLAAIVTLSAQGTHRYYTEHTKEDWRGVTTYVTSQWQPGDGVLFYMPWMEPKFRFYAERQALHLPESAYMVPEMEWRHFIVDGEMGENPDREVIARYLPDHYDRVWLVLAHYTTRNRPVVLGELREALKIKYPQEDLSTRGRIRVGLYERQAGAN